MSDTAQQGYAILSRQTAFGTAAASLGTYGLRCTSVGLTPGTDLLDDDPEIGTGRDTDTSAPVIGGFSIGGSLEGLFRPKVWPLLLLAAGFTTSGAPTQDATTGAYTHTLTPSTTLTYLTIETSWGNARAVRRFVDCLVNELTISLDANGKATWSASIIGRTEAWQGSPSTPTYETDPVANYAGSAITLDGLGTYKWESVELAIRNNLSDDEWVIGSRTLDDITPGSREVELSGTIKAGTNNPSVTDLYRAAVYGTKAATAPGGSDPYHTSAAVTFGSTRLVGTSTTVKYGATFTIPDGVLAGFPLEESGADRIAADVSVKALKGAGNVVTATVSNAFATDYKTVTG